MKRLEYLNFNTNNNDYFILRSAKFAFYYWFKFYHGNNLNIRRKNELFKAVNK